jgi:transposase-like protein
MRIESFWGYAKIRLVKFKGMNKKMFNLHLKPLINQPNFMRLWTF